MSRPDFTGIIIVADKNKADRQSIRDYFSNKNYIVFEAISEERVSEILDAHPVDLVLIDLSLSDGHDYNFIHLIRNKTNAPIVVAGNSDNDECKRMCFDDGADDYIEKPYNLNDLGARVPAHIRRYNELGTKSDILKKIKIGQWTFDLDKARLCSEQGNDCPLTVQECRLFEKLAKSQGQIITRHQEDLLDQGRSLDVHITRIRKKLSAYSNPPIIRTIRGIGYKLESTISFKQDEQQ